MAGNKRIGSHRGKGKGVCKTKWAQTHLRGEKKGGKIRKQKTNKKRSTTHQERLSWKEKEEKERWKDKKLDKQLSKEILFAVKDLINDAFKRSNN